MDFDEAVEKAPAGWKRFAEADIARLPNDVRERARARVPAGAHGERLVRGMFWTLVYHLEPRRWDKLARHEPIHPGLIEALPSHVDSAVDVGAGSGRLTAHLVKRSRRVVAVEPSSGLRELLQERFPHVEAIAGWAEALPLPDGWSQLTAACGAFGPDEAILSELRRVTTPGGTVALISPEQPEWFEAQGWKRISLPPLPPPDHPRELEEFFGPLDPPHEMVLLNL